MAPTDEPTVPVSLLRGLVRAAERSGAAVAPLLRVLQIDASELRRDELRISRHRFERACEVAVRLTGDDAFGLRWADAALKGSFGPVADGLSHAATVRGALHLLRRFEKFFTNTASHELVEEANEAGVRVASLTDRPWAIRRTLAELSTAWFVSLMRSIRADVVITRLEFGYEAPSYHEEYERVFGLPICFGRPHTQVVLPRAWLDARAAPAAPPAAPAGARRAPYSKRLHDLLLDHAPKRLGMGHAARELGVHERSLRRYLAAEGHTFKELEFAALAACAKRLLLEDQRTVEQAASAMGFARVSTFQRAFKRWSGQSPKRALLPLARASRG